MIRWLAYQLTSERARTRRAAAARRRKEHLQLLRLLAELPEDPGPHGDTGARLSAVHARSQGRGLNDRGHIRKAASSGRPPRHRHRMGAT